MIIVSACLLGFNCRYDGGNHPEEILLVSPLKNFLVPVCPEQIGGLSTPRAPSEIQGGDGLDVLEGKARVISDSGGDATDCFLRGAQEVFHFMKLMGISTAIMKEKSPSCGVCHIKRNGGILRGMGVTSALLTKNGIRVISSDRIKDEMNVFTGQVM
ncbi:MAG: DUF523 domain-containing protein [Deltaproteobacteria bacterium]|nr:DUF523 domain-containing protein [Deltaproteobacteria bacterium]